MFAHLTPEAWERFLDFLDAVDNYVERHPSTGSFQSVIEETLASIAAMPRERREPLQRFLEGLDEHFGSVGKRNA